MYSFVMLSTIIIITVIEGMRFLDVKVIANINITMQRCFYPTFVFDLNYTQFDCTAHDIIIYVPSNRLRTLITLITVPILWHILSNLT